MLHKAPEALSRCYQSHLRRRRVTGLCTRGSTPPNVRRASTSSRTRRGSTTRACSALNELVAADYLQRVSTGHRGWGAAAQYQQLAGPNAELQYSKQCEDGIKRV